MCPIISVPELLVILAIVLLIFGLGRVSRLIRGMRHGMYGPRSSVERGKDPE